MGLPRELPDRSSNDSSLRMVLLGRFKSVLPILVVAKLLVFPMTVRLLFFKASVELGSGVLE